MPNHDKEQANARRRVLYAQNKDKNNKQQHILYRAARMHVTSGKWEISDHETKNFSHHSFFKGINDQNW